MTSTMPKVIVTLGIVVSIVLLVVLLVPGYSDYTTRSQVSEGLNLAGGAKAAVVGYAQDHGSFPDSNEDADSAIDGLDLVLTVSRDRDGASTWECRSPSIPPKHLPHVCRHKP